MAAPPPPLRNNGMFFVSRRISIVIIMRDKRNGLEIILTSILFINFTSEIPNYRNYSRTRISYILPRLTDTTTITNECRFVNFKT